MKKQIIALPVILSLIFAAFILGFFLGRNRGSEIYVSVPAAMETVPPVTAGAEPTAETEAAVTFPVNLNTASERELTALPGIGETLAKRILAYREEHGPFATELDLMNVEGIGEKKMEELLEFVTTGGDV